MIDSEVKRIFDRRSALFLSTGAILTSVLILRMLQMQLFEYKDYKKKSENNSFRIQIDIPERGKILTSDGLPISHDKTIYRIYIIPEESDDVENLIKILIKELNLNSKAIKRIEKTLRKQLRFQPILIDDKSDWSVLAKIQAKNLPGVHIHSGFARIYEYGPAGAQVFGYVGAPKTIIPNAPFFSTGITGLEKTFDKELSGTVGQTVMLTNAVGRITGEDKNQFKAPVPGQNIHTTINDSAQKALYDSLSLHRSGCGIAMEIETGNILAMVSTPSFDPNNFDNDDSDEYIATLLKDTAKPFMNKTIEGLYPPGSTFKIVVALAALESGAILPSDKIFCPGHWDYGDRRYHCWEAKGHNWVDLAGALKHSCDTYFYQIALKIGIDAIKNMAVKLGFTEKYMENIFKHEMPGIIPDRKWKEKNIGVSWVHGDTIISGIGQGFILTNCLQLTIMLARVISNKKVLPKIVYTDEEQNFESLKLQNKNIKFVLKGLEQVTQEGGTAAGSAINVNGQKMGGKTGTSQVRSISKQERLTGVLTNDQLQWNMRNHGLFVGYAPTNNPKYVVCTITEHSGGSGPAARAAAATLRSLLKEKKI